MIDKKQLGTILLIAGVSVWGVYYGLKFITGMNLPIWYFLPFHLMGVIPGALLRGSKLLHLFKKERELTPEAIPVEIQ